MRRQLWALIVFAGVAQAAGVEELSWLAGQWCGESRGVYNEEVWLAPRASSMVGMHRDTKNGKLLAFEFFRIVQDGATLVYLTQPNGQPPTVFRAVTGDKHRVEFVNPAHDFPKRISYQRIDADTLLARIDDGTDAGQRLEWTWKRCAATTN